MTMGYRNAIATVALGIILGYVMALSCFCGYVQRAKQGDINRHAVIIDGKSRCEYIDEQTP